MAQCCRAFCLEYLGRRVLLETMGTHHEFAATTGRTGQHLSHCCFSSEPGFSNTGCGAACNQSDFVSESSMRSDLPYQFLFFDRLPTTPPLAPSTHCSSSVISKYTSWTFRVWRSHFDSTRVKLLTPGQSQGLAA